MPMLQILLPIATDTVGQTLYEKMMEGKRVNNVEALIPLARGGDQGFCAYQCARDRKPHRQWRV